MRIELPLPSWSEAQRAQEDAHTLTLPARHPHALPDPLPLLGALPPLDAATARVQVLPGLPPTLTLTF